MILNCGDLVSLRVPVLTKLHTDISDVDILHPQYKQSRVLSTNDHGPAYLLPGDVALVITVSSEHDHRHVYIVGPHGTGWTYSAALYILYALT